MGRGILPFGSQIALLLATASAHAQGGLFDENTVLEIELDGPLQATQRDMGSREERRFVLVHDGREIGVDVRIRGNSRVEVCRFRPLRLDFAGSAARGTPFEGLDGVKLVTHCRSGETYEQNVVEEYLAYRLFGLMSDAAFRTRLLRIRYVDTARPGREPVSRFAFAIEPRKLLAERLGGAVVETDYVRTANLDRAHTAALFVFQYLIGNTDWSLVHATGDEYCCHNVTLIGIDGVHFPVPYDFDQAGLVNARYARPHPGLRMHSVRIRRYRGHCLSGLDLETAVRRAAALEADILALIAGLPDATDGQTRGRGRYLDGFFAAARDPAALAARFEKRCVD